MITRKLHILKNFRRNNAAGGIVVKLPGLATVSGKSYKSPYAEALESRKKNQSEAENKTATIVRKLSHNMKV